jgi:hypothetical protein
VFVRVTQLDTDKNTVNADAILIDKILLDAAIKDTHLVAKLPPLKAEIGQGRKTKVERNRTETATHTKSQTGLGRGAGEAA